MNYEDFVGAKLTRQPPTGIPDAIVGTDFLFEFQADLTAWALRRGRAAIFADTGLGKSRMQITWAHRVAAHTRKPVLILAPLAVAQQTAAEAASIYVSINVVKSGAQVGGSGIYITNYERLHLFDTSVFGGVAPDESSIMKSYTSKTLAQLIESFAATPFKLCLTATPSPNDYTELGNHAEFLGICTRTEMLAEYFVHDGGETQKWRLKGHARKAFWEFVASWAALVRSPADLGYDDSAYKLPPLTVEHHVIDADPESVRASGNLFAMPARSLMERRGARKASTTARVEQCVELVNADDEPWIVWCDLNAESVALTKAIRGAVELTGSMDIDEKEAAISKFLSGEARVLVSKSSIAGFGLNLQFARKMAFVGVTDSWESYYQAVRREWRFGQKRPVYVHIFASELEGAVIDNLKRKEADAQAMAIELSVATRTAVLESVRGSVRKTNAYAPDVRMQVPNWLRKGA